MKLSVVISAYNEEKNIEDCLKSLGNIAHEIIVIDNSSQDRTAEIARKFAAKVFTRKNDPVMLNTNKNFGFSRAKGEWILSLDADERLTSELQKEIKKAILSKHLNGYEIPRKNIIFGKWIQHSFWWPDYNLRLFKKNKGKFAAKHVHEKLDVSGDISKLTNPITHYNYQTISQYIKKMDSTYTESEVENFLKSEKQINWYDSIRWPTNDFLKNFFALGGYKDGFHGLVLSILQAFYTFIFFAKVWEKKENFKDLTPDNFFIQFLKESKGASKDFRLWVFETMIKEKPKLKAYYKILRKLT